MPTPPDAAILCGGLGTRLRAVLPGLPKALAPVGGRPFLDILLEALAGAGVRRVVLCVGFGAAAIRQHVGARDWGAEIVLSEETTPLGTGGALGLARAHLHSDPVLVLNGDSWVEGLDLNALFHHPGQPALAGSLVVVPQDERADAGCIAVTEQGRIAGFREKAALPGAGYQSAGIYLLSQALLEMIPATSPCSLEHDCMPGWVEAGLRGYIAAGPLVDIGTPERLARAQPPTQ